MSNITRLKFPRATSAMNRSNQGTFGDFLRELGVGEGSSFGVTSGS
ncbi:hypothetical protein AVDCRST_MAG84-1680 [uncultured Microcoleus sp.]|uniref:Uncharacterized protein n=1 Tax=uncultured Microcoleus sp. TaxID=259945 RepID=A0A6J4L9E7_9CYAN|nr:hypothetical protein AVDCRST_MAG84-1680 [uncultured Microcoleus sp.]